MKDINTIGSFVIEEIDRLNTQLGAKTRVLVQVASIGLYSSYLGKSRLVIDLACKGHEGFLVILESHTSLFRKKDISQKLEAEYSSLVQRGKGC